MFTFTQAEDIKTSGSKITKLSFKNRFPRAKWKAAKAASASNADLADFFESFELASHINLALTETMDGVNALTLAAWPASIRLTSDEVAAILSLTISDEERPPQ